MSHTFAGVLAGVPRSIELRFDFDDDLPRVLRINAPKAKGRDFIIEYTNKKDYTVQIVSIDAWANGDGGWDWNNTFIAGHNDLSPNLSAEDTVKALIEYGYLRVPALRLFNENRLEVADEGDITVISEVIDVEEPENEDEEPQSPFMPILALSWDNRDMEQFSAASVEEIRGLLAGEAIHDQFHGMWQTRSTKSGTLAKWQQATLAVWLDAMEEEGLL